MFGDGLESWRRKAIFWEGLAKSYKNQLELLKQEIIMKEINTNINNLERKTNNE